MDTLLADQNIVGSDNFKCDLEHINYIYTVKTTYDSCTYSVYVTYLFQSLHQWSDKELKLDIFINCRHIETYMLKAESDKSSMTMLTNLHHIVQHKYSRYLFKIYIGRNMSETEC